MVVTSGIRAFVCGIIVLLAAMIPFIVSLSCGVSTVAGGDGSGTSVGNPSITGSVVTPDGTPVRSASVRLRRSNYLSSPSVTGTTIVTKGDFRDTITDDKGFFVLDSIDTGTFFIEILHGTAQGVFLSCTLSTQKLKHRFPTDTVRPVKAIAGYNRLYGGENALRYARVYGLERYVKVLDSGYFEIGVPDGTYDLNIQIKSPAYSPVDLPRITAGTVTVNAPRLAIVAVSQNYACDSMIVRALLDSNALQTTPVESVSSKEEGRLQQLTLQGSAISYVPAMIGGLRSLEYLSIINTNVSQLPDRIGELVEVEKLQLHHNQLTTLPESITKIRQLESCDIGNNRLKNLSATIVAWANQFDPDWKTTQGSR